MGTVRIIAGELRGRRLAVPRDGRVRPTPDRVREALFSILGPGLHGLEVADLYAGTGALGLEALSRGAHRITFVEADRSVAESLRRNLASLGVQERCRVVFGAVEAALAGPPRSAFDLVLADPPYEDWPGPRLLEVLTRPGLLGPGARIAIQRDRAASPARSPALEPNRTARYGRTCLDFYSVPPSS